MQNNRNDIPLENAILDTIAYFDIFNYPLAFDEIRDFLSIPATESELKEILDMLVSEGKLCSKCHWYSLRFSEPVFTRRLKGNNLAAALYPCISAQAKRIFQFPFVRAVFASGSFSKNYMDEYSDFDFFIVCKNNRLWISRMMLILYKRLFLGNSHKQFCVNYFVDEQNLMIAEQNIFSATELATVIPLTGSNYYEKLLSHNRSWLDGFFPMKKYDQPASKELQSSWIKKILETLLNMLGGRFINLLFRFITIVKWKSSYADSYSKDEFDHAFKSTVGVSKNHPRNFQKHTLTNYQQKISELRNKTLAA